MNSEVWQVILTGFLILLGLAGSFLPILPGPPIAWAGLFLFGVFTDFQKVTVSAVIIFGIAMILFQLVDILAPVLGARGYKASRSGVVGAFIGGIFGVFILGPLGIILGPFLGAFLGEYYDNRDHNKSLRAAWGSFVGFLIGTAGKIIVVLAMLVYFIIALI